MKTRRPWWAVAQHSLAAHGDHLPQDSVADGLIMWSSARAAQNLQWLGFLMSLSDSSPELASMTIEHRSILLFAAVMHTAIEAQRKTTVPAEDLLIPGPIRHSDFVRSGIFDERARAAAQAVCRWAALSTGIELFQMATLSFSGDSVRSDFIVRIAGGEASRSAYFSLTFDDAAMLG